jgi:hypothetical protein
MPTCIGLLSKHTRSAAALGLYPLLSELTPTRQISARKHHKHGRTSNLSTLTTRSLSLQTAQTVRLRVLSYVSKAKLNWMKGQYWDVHLKFNGMNPPC